MGAWSRNWQMRGSGFNPGSVSITGGTITGLSSPLPIASGGTGGATAAAARTALSVPQIGPTFSANLTGNQSLTSGASAIVIYTSTDFDTGTYYNASTGVFTPLVSGYYHFDWSATADGNGSTLTNAFTSLFKNGAEYQRGSQTTVAAAAVNGFDTSSGGITVFMNGTTDFVDVRMLASTSAGNPRILGSSITRFSGHFLRP